MWTRLSSLSVPQLQKHASYVTQCHILKNVGCCHGVTCSWLLLMYLVRCRPGSLYVLLAPLCMWKHFTLKVTVPTTKRPTVMLCCQRWYSVMGTHVWELVNSSGTYEEDSLLVLRLCLSETEFEHLPPDVRYGGLCVCQCFRHLSCAGVVLFGPRHISLKTGADFRRSLSVPPVFL